MKVQLRKNSNSISKMRSNFPQKYIKQDSPPVKRTACAVTCPGITSPPGEGGIPHPVLAGGHPILSWTGGGYFILFWMGGGGGYPNQSWPKGRPSCLGPILSQGPPPPQKGHGTSGSIMGWRWGLPPPPGCEQTENITFPILRMRAVIRNRQRLYNKAVRTNSKHAKHTGIRFVGFGAPEVKTKSSTV